MEITIRYNILGRNEDNALECYYEIPDEIYEKLKKYEDEGEYLSDYLINNKMPEIHQSIIQAIRLDIDDRMGETTSETYSESGALPWTKIERWVEVDTIPDEFYVCLDNELEYELEL